MNVKFGIRQISATPVQIRQISATPFTRINVLLIFALFGQIVAAFCLHEGKKLQHEVKKMQQRLIKSVIQWSFFYYYFQNKYLLSPLQIKFIQSVNTVPEI